LVIGKSVGFPNWSRIGLNGLWEDYRSIELYSITQGFKNNVTEISGYKSHMYKLGEVLKV
jgi:hypothetical protein